MNIPERDPLVVSLVQKIAPRLGLVATIFPELGYFGSIKASFGPARYMQGSSFDINPRTASEVANSKQATNTFLEKWGYRTIQGDSFLLEGERTEQSLETCLQAALSYTETVGFPLFVKPNSLSQGIGVAKVYGPEDFREAVRYILERDDQVMVQEAVAGKDYRIIVLDDQVVCAYLRQPLAIYGDGSSTVGQLLSTRHAEVEAQGASVRLDDPRILATLARNQLELTSTLEQGRELVLLGNANLSAGGTAVDMSDSIDQGFKDLAIAVTRDMGLRYAGVDMLIQPDISDPNASYTIIELNAAPGLDNFAALGERQLQVVEDHYELILKKMMGL